MDVRTATGEKFGLDQAINRGGEAQIWSVRQDPHLVAKLYHQPTAEHQAKLTAMIAAPLTHIGSHPTVAWPLQLLYRQKSFVGYLMPRAARSLPLFHYYNPARRRRLGLPHAWPRFLHRTATNLAAAVELVHAHDHVIGDLNESNALVTQAALVTLVDTDSFQIRQHSHAPQRASGWLGPLQTQQIYRCSVGKAEYTAPELQGVDFKTIDRTPAQDNFALAVLLFYLLMEGFHPFAGVLSTGASVGRVDLHGIKHGLFPYVPQKAGTQLLVQPPPNAPAIAQLYPGLQEAFRRTFVDGHRTPERRVTAKEWKKVLQEAEEALVTCPQEQGHLYSRHLRRCPICKPLPASVAPVTPGTTTGATLVPSPRIMPTVHAMTTVWPRLPLTWAATIWPRISQPLHKGGQGKLTMPPLYQAISSLQPDWRLHTQRVRATLATLPARVAVARQVATTHADLLGSWFVSNLIGTALAALAAVGGYSLLPQLDRIAPISQQQQVMLLVMLFAALLGLCQAYTLRRAALLWSHLHYAWVGMAVLSGAMMGAAGFRLLGAAWDQVALWSAQGYQLTTLAALFGLLLGFLQSLLLRQQLHLADDGRVWTIINGTSGILLAQGWLWGQTLPTRWSSTAIPDWQINAGMGALVGVALGALFSGSVLLWMIQGPRRTFYLHQFALNLLRWSVRPPRVRRGVGRWGRAILLLLLIWAFLQLVTQWQGAAVSGVPALPTELIPHLGPFS